jgi:glycolate oxidase iron-sulfur subunit
MQTQLSEEFRGTDDGREAEAILRKCVHCGFCLATCPTYQLLGDELDSPRGRIYLIKQVLEGQAPTALTQRHLDRCLTCRNCESTCPSGVEYGRLVDIGRRVVEARVPRPNGQAALRWLLRAGLDSPLFAPAVALGRRLGPLLPERLRSKLSVHPPQGKSAASARRHDRRVLLLAGCVQPALLPGVGAASRRLLDAAGFEVLVAPGAGCCGAIREHLADHDGALRAMRRNVDAWWPAISGGDGGPPVEAIVSDASGCGVMLEDYGRLLARESAYAKKAQRVSELAQDIGEVVEQHASRVQEALARAHNAGGRRAIAVHIPCTLQHGQKQPGLLHRILPALGLEVAPPCGEAHLCCGSAGTYSLLQPQLAARLRDRKLDALREQRPDCIVSANVGCIQHLQSGTHLPVRHWVEVVAELLPDDAVAGSKLN